MLFFITWPITSRLSGNAEDPITYTRIDIEQVITITGNHR